MNSEIMDTVRDLSRFPHDEVGDLLWAFSQTHAEKMGADDAEVRFALLFADYADALKYGVFLLRHEYRVKVNSPGAALGQAEVLVDMYLDLNYSDITEAIRWLSETSSTLEARLDGLQIQLPNNTKMASSAYQHNY